MFLKFAPLAFWAIIILFVSSNNVGINLSAIAMVKEISCEFIFIKSSGDSIFSSANEKFREDVVNIIVVPTTVIISNLKNTIMLFLIIMGFIKKQPVDKNEVSKSKNKFMQAVNADTISMLLVLFKYFIIGISDLYAKKREYEVSKNAHVYVEI